MKRDNLRKVNVYSTPKHDDILFTGFFHGWSLEYEEFEFGIGNETVAIIEKSNGKIELVYPAMIRFIDFESGEKKYYCDDCAIDLCYSETCNTTICRRPDKIPNWKKLKKGGK